MTWTPKEMMTIRMAKIALQAGEPASARRMLEPLLPKALSEHHGRQRADPDPVAVLQQDGATIIFTRVQSDGASP